MSATTDAEPRAAPFPQELLASGVSEDAFDTLLAVAELPPGSMHRVSRGDLDVLLAHTTDGIVATHDPDGGYHPTWTPGGRDPKVDPPGKKAAARALTRVRRFRYFPVRIRDGMIEVALPDRG